MQFNLSAIKALEQQRYYIYPDVNTLWDGNSLTRSHHTTGIEQFMPGLVQSWLAQFCRSLTHQSIGVGGQTIETMVTNYPVNVAPFYDPAKLNVLIFGENANGIAAGETGQQNLDRVNAYAALAKATGWDIVVFWNDWYKRTPYSPSDSAASRQRKQDFLDLVDGGGLVNVDFRIDMRTLPNVGGPAGQAQDENFDDHIHLTELGNREVANRFKIELTTIFNPYKI